MADDRVSAARRGYGRKWQAYREQYLREHPLCVDHLELGRFVPSTVVDHIRKPRDEAGEIDHKLFWSPSNHQALCKHCHDSHKQRLEKSGAVVGCSLNGVPLDPNHHWARG